MDEKNGNIIQFESKNPSIQSLDDKLKRKRSTINYDAIYPYFLSGMSYRALADQFQVSFAALCQHGTRNKWEAKRQELKLSKKVQAKDLDPVKVAQAIVNYRQSFVKNVAEAADDTSLSLISKVKDVKTFEEKALAMSQFKPAFDIGKGVFGLGNESPTNNFQVNVVSNMTWDDMQEVIEVEPVKEIKRATKE